MSSLKTASRSIAQTAVKYSASMIDRVRMPAPGAVVLIYHRVGAASGLEVDLPDALFDAQMATLAETQRATNLDTALHAVSQPTPSGFDPVVVTFDDGTADFVDRALPIIVRHKIPTLLYVATDFVTSGRSFPDDGHPASWASLRDAVATGFVEIGSHTHTHALLDRLDPNDVAEELDTSRKIIADSIGLEAKHFAYPKALLGSPAAQTAVAQRFVSAAIAGTRANPYGHTDPQRVWRTPVQRSDAMRWFAHKLAGGMRFEDELRGFANRVRYRGATS